MEEIFKERQIFKNKVIENVQTELNQFGLRIYNANVKELQDTAGSEYFKFLSRKAHEGASNQAKVDVANACMMGEIGVCISFLEMPGVFREQNSLETLRATSFILIIAL